MSLRKKEQNGKVLFLKIFLFLAVLLAGGYHVFVSGALSVVLCVYLIIEASKGEGEIKLSFPLISLLLIPLAYLAATIWAVDRGTAIFGFVKFLPVGLFALCIHSLTREEKGEILNAVPVSGAVLGVLSYLLSFLPTFSEYFLVADRLGGSFQYPNTFALYCLAGIVILLTKKELQAKDWIMSALLSGCIFLSGSRTVFIFLLITAFILFIRLPKKAKISLAALLGGVILLSISVVLVTDSVQTVGRFLTISLESSTLNGRILYYLDALPVILKNPLGLGYYGYYFSQGSFQTGVYSVAFIHNDLLQLLLDIGWVPTILLLITAGLSFFSGESSFREKMLIFIIAGHSLFDFNLQFVSMFLLLALCADYEKWQLIPVKAGRLLTYSLSSVLLLVSLYFSVVHGLYYIGETEMVEEIYGAHTQTEMELMSNEDDYTEIEKYADSILRRNEYISIAYDAKANAAFSQGDFEKVVEYKEKAIECSPYAIDEYNDYCEKMLIGATLYKRAGNERGEIYCNDRLVKIKKSLEKLEERTSFFGKRIDDEPQYDLLPEYEDYIKELKQ